MIIITASSFIPAIILAAHSMSMDVCEVDSQQIINDLNEEMSSGDHNGRLYCWSGNVPVSEIPEEVEAIMSYNDLFAEEFEFPSLEEGDVVYVYTMVDTDEEVERAAWHMITFESIDR